MAYIHVQSTSCFGKKKNCSSSSLHLLYNIPTSCAMADMANQYAKSSVSMILLGESGKLYPIALVRFASHNHRTAAIVTTLNPTKTRALPLVAEVGTPFELQKVTPKCPKPNLQ